MGKFLSFLVAWLFLVSQLALAQEMNLAHLYNDWAINYEESKDDIVILRSVKGNGFSKLKDRSDIYNFNNINDSIICRKKIKIMPAWCGNDFRNSDLGLEIWSLNAKKKVLWYEIYESKGVNRKTLLLKTMYQIKSVGKTHLKLHFKKELYAGEE